MDTYHTFEKPKEEQEENEKGGPNIFTESQQKYTIEEAIEQVGFGKFQIQTSMIAGLAWIADSMELMVLSILGPVLVCEWKLGTTNEALITTVVFIGFMIGAPAMGWLADTYGRKTSLIIAALWASFYGILSACSPMYSWLLVLRGLTGMGLAGVPQAVTYYSEFLPRKYRGKCIVLLEAFWAVGAIFEVLLAMLLVDPVGWRWWLMASAFPLLLFVPSVLTLPESPRFLLAIGDVTKATEALQQVALINKKSLPPGSLAEETQSRRGHVKDLVSNEYRVSSIMLWAIWFVATFSYYGIVLVTTELIAAGTTCISDEKIESINGECPAECDALTKSDYMQLLWTSVAEIPGVLLTALYVDFIGRRVAIFINLVVFSAAIFLLFICAGKTFLIAMLFVGRAFISSGLQVIYVYTPELYPTTIRAIGMGSCNVFARLGAITTPFVAQVFLHQNIAGALSLYGSMGLVGALLALLLPIETRGRELQMGVH